MASIPPGAQARLAALDAAGSTPLSVGSVVFATTETPDGLTIGGAEQMMVVHHLVGGGVVQQSFGVKPLPVSWRGTIFAPNVQLRVQELALYLAAGVEVSVAWGIERYFGVVKRFVPTYHSAGTWAEYEIELEITRDANGRFTVSAATSIDQQIAALQAQANTANSAVLAADPAGAAALQQPLANMNATIAASGPVAQNPTTAAPAISASAQIALGVVQSYLATLVTTGAAFPSASTLASSLKLIIANVLRGQAPQARRVQGGSLFAVAARQGDVTKAFALAAVNGLPSVFLTASTGTSLSLPPFAGS